MNTTLKGFGIGILVFALVFFIAYIAVGIHDQFNNKGGFKISELSEGVSYQTCTSSVNSPTLLCNNEPNNMAFHLYNMSQERLNEILKNCVNAEIIQDTYCIGNRLEIRGGKNE